MLCILFFLGFSLVSGHDDEIHDSIKQETSESLIEKIDSEDGHESKPQHFSEESTHPYAEKKVTADLEDFPNLHPLLVHFAIVLIIIGALIQVLHLILLKKEIAWFAFFLVLGGVVTAYLVGIAFHPHTEGLTAHAKLVMEQHDYWAEWTINLGIVGTVLQGINLFVWQKKRWAIALVTLVLLGAAYSVAQAGHYGAQLVHIEGVGPEVNYLETTNSHSH